MSLNQALMTLNTSKNGIYQYKQKIIFSNPFIDSAYNNHITFYPEYIEITIPKQITAIDNIDYPYGDVFLYDLKNKSIRSIYELKLLLQPICLRIRYNKINKGNEYITFNAYIFKSYVKNILLSKL